MSLKRSSNLAPRVNEMEDDVSDEAAAVAVMTAELVARGVGAEFAERVSRELAGSFAALPPAVYERALTGVVRAWEARGRKDASGATSDVARPLRELQTLMSSFVGELTKLDEALEVLAAYLRRMRQTADGASPPSPTGRFDTIH